MKTQSFKLPILALRLAPALALFCAFVPTAHAEKAPKPLDAWSYKARAEADAQAGEGVARAIPPGNTDDNHAFDWRLYDLPNGVYRVTMRLKAAQQPQKGAFWLNVTQQRIGKDQQQAGILGVGAAAFKVGDYQEFSTDVTLQSDWPYTYYFFRLENTCDIAVSLDRVDLLLVKKLPATPREPSLKEWNFKGTGVPDPAATDGVAAAASGFGTNLDAPLGRYEAILRLAKKDVTGDALHRIAAGFNITAGGDGAGGTTGGGLSAYLAPMPSSFRPGRYEEFRFPFEVLFPSTVVGAGAWGQPASNVADITVDSVRFRLLERYTESQGLAKAGIPHAEPQLIAHTGTRVWLAHGLFEEDLKLRAGLEAAGVQIVEAAFDIYHGTLKLAGQVPQKYRPVGAAADTLKPDTKPAPNAEPFEERLMAYDAVILQDVPGRLVTLQQRMLIHDFVQAGGGLLVVGGMYGLDRGGYQNSDLLNAVLPATLAESASLHRLAAPAPLRVGTDSRLFKSLALDDKPVVDWLHVIKPKTGATVELAAGDAPVLVTWQSGKGRVALLAAPPFGAPKSGVLFSDSHVWLQVMQKTLQWLCGK